MNVYVILASGANPESGVDVFISEMFHGKARRGGAFPTASSARVMEETDRPLRLHKNLFGLSEVFSPGNSGFVFSANAVTKILEHYKSLEFEKVVFEHVYNFEFDVNSKVHFDEIGNFNRQMRFIDNVPHDSTLATPEYSVFKPNFPNWKGQQETHHIEDEQDCVLGWPMRPSSLPYNGRFFVDTSCLQQYDAITPFLADFLIVTERFLQLTHEMFDPWFYTTYKLQEL